ncbi:MAG: hypothetical protein HYY49_02580 [Ignavibacteriales bacterium]|nr:hypothetical protein [Ignavibacteriales bacterium]
MKKRFSKNDPSLPGRDGYSLATIVRNVDHLKIVRKSDLHRGDLVFVKTVNSVYRIEVLGGGFHLVSGGWFDIHAESPQKTTIVGCTWGGSAIKVDIIAACGLCVEFGNGVTTSVIQKIYVVPQHGDMRRLRLNGFAQDASQTIFLS